MLADTHENSVTTPQLRAGLPPLPANMRTLPLDSRGYPVPNFVWWDGDRPEFRVLKPGSRETAIIKKLCWICGKLLGRTLVFVSGPMSGISGVSAEPPSHWECAQFAALACPFLALPKAARREAGLPEGIAAIAGDANMIMRNPGVAMLWYTRDYEVFKTKDDFVLFMGKPTQITWYAHGRAATREEVEESIRLGWPLLQQSIPDQDPAEEDRLRQRLETLRKTFPKE